MISTPPPAITELLRHAENFRNMMNAFADEMPHALASGRQELWAKAAHSVIDLHNVNHLKNRNSMARSTTQPPTQQGGSQ